MGINLSTGVWYDVGGTEDVLYALGEITVDEIGGMAAKYYDSVGSVLRSVVGKVNISATGVTGMVLQGPKSLPLTNLVLLSPPEERDIRVLGSNDASTYRVFKRNPLMTRIERLNIARVLDMSGLPTKLVRFDPALSTLIWDEILETHSFSGSH